MTIMKNDNGENNRAAETARAEELARLLAAHTVESAAEGAAAADAETGKEVPRPGTDIHPAPAALKPSAHTRSLGNYELLRRLGEGAMAVVYKALDRRNNRQTALKILPRKMAGDAEFLERFIRETKALESLSHPNIVAVYDSGTIGGWFFYAMEYVPGESLLDLLEREEHLSEKESLRLTGEIAAALAHAHRKHIIHRDVKPDNVLLAVDGGVKLTDFGLAKLLAADSKLTAAGIAVGTPHYLSPEQAVGSLDVDRRADLYGLGVTLFQMLTGRLPFDAETAAEVMARQVNEPPPDPRQFAPTLSRGVARLVLRLLAKKPENRPASAEEVIAAVEALLRGDEQGGPPTPATGLKRLSDRLNVGGKLGKAFRKLRKRKDDQR